MSLPLIRPSLRRQDFDHVLDAMVHDRLSSGDINRNLCKEVIRTLGFRDVAVFAAVNDAIRFVLNSFGLVCGDRIILSPLAPSYWVPALELYGVQPVFADVLADTPVLNSDLVKSLVKPETKAVVADCCLGYLPNFALLKDLGIIVIEDVSQGFGGRIDGSLVGSFGDGVIANFTPETLVAGAGGCLAGLRGPGGSEKVEVNPWESLSDLGSALILSQWQDALEFAQKKRENYRQLFHRLPKGYRQPKQVADSECVNPWFPILVESGAKDVLAHSRKKAVEADWAFRSRPYLNSESDSDFCPNARYFLFHTLIFPLYSLFSAKELELLGKVISSMP